MKKLLLFIFPLASLTSFGQDINIGKRDTVFSEILNQDRPFSVYLPQGYYNNENQEFPVLYILDGEYNFRYVSGLLELEGGISERIPKMILVAISGKGSETYSHNCKPNITGIEDKGNADKVANFIANELIPYVNTNYKTNDFKILSGHSLGGLFIINTALHHPKLFNHYIAISPALWWQGNAINQIAQQKTKDGFKANVYVSLANEKGMGVDSFLGVATSSILKNNIFIGGLALFSIVFTLILGVKRKKIILPVLVAIIGCGISAYLYFYYYPENDNFKFKQFSGENHNSVGEPTYRWALEDIFKIWREENQYFSSTEEFKNHYEKVKNTYGTTFNIPYTILGNTHYMLQDKPKELQKLLMLLKTKHPNAFSTFAIYRANKLLEGQPQVSQNLAMEVLANNPKSFESMNILAKIKLAKNKVSKADSLINKAIGNAKLQKTRQWKLNELIDTKEKIVNKQ